MSEDQIQEYFKDKEVEFVEKQNEDANCGIFSGYVVFINQRNNRMMEIDLNELKELIFSNSDRKKLIKLSNNYIIKWKN